MGLSYAQMMSCIVIQKLNMYWILCKTQKMVTRGERSAQIEQCRDLAQLKTGIKMTVYTLMDKAKFSECLITLFFLRNELIEMYQGKILVFVHCYKHESVISTELFFFFLLISLYNHFNTSLNGLSYMLSI